MASTVDRTGITVLYEPEAKEPNADIVFVHGLFGHPKKTWTCATVQHGSETQSVDSEDEDAERPPRKKTSQTRKSWKEVYWPQDLLPKVMPQARILTWGYDVSIDGMFSPASRASVFQHAETLLFDLASLRKTPSHKARPIIFVVHSLGGVVVKDALALSKIEKTFLREIFPATAGVCFLGTPHRGSKAASIGKIAFEISRLFFKDPNLKILRALEINSEILERVAKSFCQILRDGNIRVHSFHEELPLAGVQIVDTFSSSIGDASETRGVIRANHRNMARFSCVTDPGFKRVTSVLLRWEYDLMQEKAVGTHMFTTRTRADVVRQLIDENVRQACLDALDESEARDRIRNVEKTFGDTYGWLFKRTVDFEDWLNGKPKSTVYWIRGKPGSGKSTVMKFALQHNRTRQLLKEYSDSTWIVAGFFFHDRGSNIQKSVQGLLFEILFQVLTQRRDLIDLVLSTFPKFLKLSRSGGGATHATMTWTLEDVKDALLFIASQQSTTVNMALFIDALDEHSGDHRELLNTLDGLIDRARSENFRLRLCVASRPENIFQHTFGNAPGFTIHKMTEGDIRQFATGRIQPKLSSDLEPAAAAHLEALVEEVIAKAEGVFIWVKLVVDELIEGLCEGDSIEELRNILSVIPSELEGLYRRAIQRCPRSSPHQRAKHRLEASTLFRIALCSSRAYQIDYFLEVANSIMSGQCLSASTNGFWVAQARRRLDSRSAGLLEVVWDSRDGNVVQFIHQTVKDFMRKPAGLSTVYEETDGSQEGGHVLLLRYYADGITKRRPDADDKLGPEFLYHIHRAESTYDKPSLHHIETLVREQSEAARFESVLNILRTMTGFRTFSDAIAAARDTQLTVLMIAACGCLPLSLEEKLQTCSEVAKMNGGVLLAGAVWGSKRFGVRDQHMCIRVMELLFDIGIGPDTPFQGFTAISRYFQAEIFVPGGLPNHFQGWGIFNICSGNGPFRKLLFSRGADPNQKVSSARGEEPLLTVVLLSPFSRDDLETLLRAGADPSTPDSFGYTSLFYAICQNDQKAVKLLLAYGADPSSLNTRGLSALNPDMQYYVRISDPLGAYKFVNYNKFVENCISMHSLFIPKPSMPN